MRLLIVGTLEGYISRASQLAIQRGAQVVQVSHVRAALQALRDGRGADLLMVDEKLDIAYLVSCLKKERIAAPVIACGLGQDPDRAEAVIRAGAKEYIPLPPDPDAIASVLAAVGDPTQDVVYEALSMVELYRLAAQFAVSDASVLITGESGTGKEVLARHLHRRSKRAQRRFVAINCAAIPENLLESELFGYEKGAFTGAIARRIGKFEEADHGTLLLDEISEMDLRLQAKLLRVVQEREIDRLGGSKPVKVNVRILATSNRDLHASVRDKTFREDLYFRLNVVHLQIPPLRERPEDIEPLGQAFARKYARINGYPERPLGAEAIVKLGRHSWPGNVRELENTVHRAVVLNQAAVIGPEVIMLQGESGLSFSGASSASPEVPENSEISGISGAVQTDATGHSASLVGKTVAEVEQTLILDTLEHCLGNRTRAAELLGISIRTLRSKLHRYQSREGQEPPSQGPSKALRSSSGAPGSVPGTSGISGASRSHGDT